MQSDDWKALKAKLETLFNSGDMIQIQVDRFIRLIESVRDDLERIFNKSTFSAAQVKWAIDTKVQQGKLPVDRDINRIRKQWARLDGDEEKRKPLLALVDKSSAGHITLTMASTNSTSSGPSDSARRRVPGSDPHLPSDTSRAKQDDGGYDQALTFERSARSILGVGSAEGNRTGISPRSSCIDPGAVGVD
jgi:uncharacterized LabA/DUF88 family protein